MTISVQTRFTFLDQQLLAKAGAAGDRAARRYLAIVRQDARKAIKVKAATMRDLRTAKGGSREAIRRRAKQRIADKRRMTSQPGQPPFSHLRGKVGLKLIEFAYDRQQQVGLVGYVKYRAAKSRKAIPKLEYGGTVTITQKSGRRVRRRSVRLAARPNINPQARRHLPKLRQFMEGAIR